jgi:hypothetical protein
MGLSQSTPSYGACRTGAENVDQSRGSSGKGSAREERGEQNLQRSSTNFYPSSNSAAAFCRSLVSAIPSVPSRGGSDSRRVRESWRFVGRGEKEERQTPGKWRRERRGGMTSREKSMRIQRGESAREGMLIGSRGDDKIKRRRLSNKKWTVKRWCS